MFNTNNNPFIDVYLAEMPKILVEKINIYPNERKEEILSCKNQNIKLQKYYIWKLLEIICNDFYKINFNDIKFTKEKNGKWICHDFHFSLSHCDKMLAIAISNFPIGIDLEVFQPNFNFTQKIFNKIMNDNDLKVIETKKIDMNKYFIIKWTQKESEFKRGNYSNFEPKKIYTHNCFTKKIKKGETIYFYSLSSEVTKKIRKTTKIIIDTKNILSNY